jgi:uncharacterized membrane protein YfcA
VADYGAGNTFKLGEVRSGPPDYFPQVSYGTWFIIGTVAGALIIIYLLVQKKLTKYQMAILLVPVFIVGIVLGRYIGIENMQTYRQLYHGYFLMLLPFAIALWRSWHGKRQAASKTCSRCNRCDNCCSNYCSGFYKNLFRALPD